MTCGDGLGGGLEIFAFPFVSIGNMARLDAGAILTFNDDNSPFSFGRAYGQADDSGMILLEAKDPLNAA